MSSIRGYIDDNPELESALDWVEAFYHVPVLLALLGFMLWNRVRSWENFVVGGEVLYSGNDPWYHFRTTMYTVKHWPATQPFDPWTQFPLGTSSGQFGTLFDQIIATAALIVGLGSPSEGTVAMTLLVAPAVFGTLVAIPAYFMGRRVGGRIGGVTAVVVVALSAGSLLARSLVGTADHHVAEALFQALGVLGVMAAVSVAERDRPVYEQFVARDVDALRETVVTSVLAGVAIALYLWTWPPGVLLLGILGTFFLLRLVVEFLRGDSPEHTAVAAVITMTTAGVLGLAVIETLQITATAHSTLQPLLAFVVAGGSAFMAWLARYVEAEDLNAYTYPVTVFGTILVLAGLMAVVLPNIFSFFVDQTLRIIGFSVSPTAGTVGEAQPLRSPRRLFSQYGLNVAIAAIGVVGILAEQVIDDDAPAEEFLIAVWTVFIVAATFTQARFSYYLTVPVAVLTALVVSRVVDWIGLSFTDDIETYQVLSALALLLVVVAPLALAGPTAVDYGKSASPGQGIQGWDSSLQWMESNTPAVGAYGTGEEGSLEYYGTYPNQEDFDYQTGDYGVISWWDYGHWITTRAERIPVANPFQQGANKAANFLLADNETEANEVLGTVSEDDAKTRYVAVDWKMAQVHAGTGFGGKFFAPPEFSDRENVSQSDYYRPVFQTNQEGQVVDRRFYYRTPEYYNTTVVRLYEYHGSAVEAQPLVFDWTFKRVQDGSGQVRVPADQPIRQFQNMSAARQYVQEDGTAQVGGFGSTPSQRVPAMEHYRFVGSSTMSAYESSSHNRARLFQATGSGLQVFPAQGGSCGENFTAMPIRGRPFCLPNQNADLIHHTEPTWTKIFERVPGGTVRGEAPANTTVTASVQMRNTRTNETFVYRQQAETGPDGEFEMTLPYSTTGYDEYGPSEGYTNVSVRAVGNYTFTAGQIAPGYPAYVATGDVTEGQVIGENDSATTVELESLIQTDNATAGGSSGDDTSSDGNSTSGSLAPPTATARPAT